MRIETNIHGVEYRDHKYRKDRRVQKNVRNIFVGGKNLEKHLCDVRLGKGFVDRTQKALSVENYIVYLTLLLTLSVQHILRIKIKPYMEKK